METIKSMNLQYRIPQDLPQTQKNLSTSFTTLITLSLTTTIQKALTIHTTVSNVLNYRKEIRIIAKIYTKEQKYSRVDKSFDYKLKIFYNICKRARLSNTAYIDTFLTMLKSLVQDYFYNHNFLERLFNQVCTHLYNFFESSGYY
jgi:hypothetical protein